MAASMSDAEYHNLWNSLSTGQEAHVCTRQCEFKQVFGNMWYCCTSGQAHVCDQNCTQRIFYDNHHDICRLSKKLFPRCDQAMGDLARKRSSEAEALQNAKRPQSAGDWQAQQAAAAATSQQQQQQHGVPGWQPHVSHLQPQAPPQGWAC